MSIELPADRFIELMDAKSRTRALNDRESLALEQAIVTGKVSKREAARLGMKRDLSAYSARRAGLPPRASLAECKLRVPMEIE